MSAFFITIIGFSEMLKCLIYLLLVIPISAQQFYSFDYAQFFNSKGESYIDLFYQFDLSKMTKKEGEYKSELTISFTNKDDSTKSYSNKWQLSLNEKSNNIHKVQTGVISIALEPGEYNLVISAEDLIGKYKNTDKMDLKLLKYIPDSFMLSDIEVAHKLVQQSDNKESVFYKNTMEVYPNPTRIFGDHYPALFFYTEIYNTNKVDADHNFEFTYKLLNAKTEEVFTKTKDLNKSDNSIVEVGVINTSKLNSGTYSLLVSLKDVKSNMVIAKGKKIFVYNEGKVDSALTADVLINNDNIVNSFGFLAEGELDLIYDKSKYLADKNEVARWKNLTGIDAKSKFLAKFWSYREVPWNTGTRLTYTEYMERINEANDLFSRSFSKKKGYRTDKGRVYVLYGKPTNIENYHNELESKPFEIWYYDHIEGGVLFVFSDQTGFGEWRLEHSTKEGEQYNAKRFEDITDYVR